MRPPPPFPAEILDELIDQIDSKTTLLSFSLVCRRTLVRTRRHLFYHLKFTDYEDFSRFLYLAGAPWTSFTLSVKEIHLRDLMFPKDGYDIDPKKIASNLCNVKSLTIFSQLLWGQWRFIPCCILDIISQLKIHDLQLNGLKEAKYAVILLSRLPPTVKTLALQLLQFRKWEEPNFLCQLPLFHRHLRFRILDNQSLTFLGDVLDPLVNPGLDVTVQAFHIRVPTLSAAEVDNPLTWRFLQHVGHGVEQLLVTFGKLYMDTDESTLSYLESIQVTRCVNIRILYIRFPRLIYASRLSLLLVPAMWKMLSALPSPNILEEFRLKVNVDTVVLDDRLSKLRFFESPNCLDKFRSMFPNLKLIALMVGMYDPENIDTYFEALRRANGLRELEESGIVKLVAVDIDDHVACHSNLEGCCRW